MLLREFLLFWDSRHFSFVAFAVNVRGRACRETYVPDEPRVSFIRSSFSCRSRLEKETREKGKIEPAWWPKEAAAAVEKRRESILGRAPLNFERAQQTTAAKSISVCVALFLLLPVCWRTISLSLSCKGQGCGTIVPKFLPLLLYIFRCWCPAEEWNGRIGGSGGFARSNHRDLPRPALPINENRPTSLRDVLHASFFDKIPNGKNPPSSLPHLDQRMFPISTKIKARQFGANLDRLLLVLKESSKTRETRTKHDYRSTFKIPLFCYVSIFRRSIIE